LRSSLQISPDRFYFPLFPATLTTNALPAMEAGISDHIWTIEELRGLLLETASATKRIDKGLILKALGEQPS
jgi:hypothetical protein